jgi:hypothetical protein
MCNSLAKKIISCALMCACSIVRSESQSVQLQVSDYHERPIPRTVLSGKGAWRIYIESNRSRWEDANHTAVGCSTWRFTSAGPGEGAKPSNDHHVAL